MTFPPFPPLPPLGPPRGTNFSRRKLTQPRPPSPARTWISTSSTNTAGRGHGRRRLGGGFFADAHKPPAVPLLESDDAVRLREQREVDAEADVPAREEPRAALPDEDRAGGHPLTREALDPEHLGLAVPTVPRATDALLVRHLRAPCLLRRPLRSA